MNAQVTIGSDQDPHGGAVLDLSQTSGTTGFLLPRVVLTDLKQWTPLGATSANGVGMVVYNVNEEVGTGAGVYVWSGDTDGWIPLKSNFSNAVKLTGFDLTPAESSVDIWENGTQNFRADNFYPEGATYQGVTWEITSGKTIAQITAMSATTCTVKGLAAGDATLKVSGIDEFYWKEVAVHVNPVTVKSFSLDKSTLSLQINGATGTIAASNFIGSDDQPMSGITVTWSIIGDLPTGSTIDPTTGNNTTTVTSGTATGTFTVRATVGSITHDCEVTIDDCSSVTDAEGNSYVAAKFGAAGCWMTQNLRSTTGLTRNGNAGSDASLKYYYYPEYKQATFTAHTEYGLLYTWAAATGRTGVSTNEGNDPGQTQYQGICPTGWHVPSDYEWSQLEEVIAKDTANVYSTTGATTWESSYFSTSDYRGAHGQKMKSATAVVGSTGGTSKARAANGFDALLTGNVNGGAQAAFGVYFNFWSSSSGGGSNAWYRSGHSGGTGVTRQASLKVVQRCVRCKKNDN
jgi:uncharacterized protein (TIGR02145 family)